MSGRSDHFKGGEGETPEALDYDPDVDAVRRRVPGFEIEKMSGRGGGEDEEEESVDKVYGKYTPNYRLVERNQETGAIDFGRQTGRDSENSDEVCLQNFTNLSMYGIHHPLSTNCCLPIDIVRDGTDVIRPHEKEILCFL